MDWKLFFKFTKTKVVYLIVIALIILISGSFADNVIMCIQAPCPQESSSIFGQNIYSIVTFGKLFINTQFAVTIKNFMHATFGFSAGTAYKTLSFIISLILHYLLISAIISGYTYFRKKH
jgi:hypothetical protein